MAVVGQEMELTITATDPNGDDLTYSLYEDITNATITKLNNNGKAKHDVKVCVKRLCTLLLKSKGN